MEGKRADALWSDGGWDEDRRSRGLGVKTDVGVRMHDIQGIVFK